MGHDDVLMYCRRIVTHRCVNCVPYYVGDRMLNLRRTYYYVSICHTLYLCVHIGLHTCVCVCMCSIHAYSVYICMFARAHTHTCARIDMHTHTHARTHMHTHTNTHTHMRTHTHTHTCIHMHTYTHKLTVIRQCFHTSTNYHRITQPKLHIITPDNAGQFAALTLNQ